MTRVPLSVLDLSPVGSGQTTSDALRASTRLAQVAEDLGLLRFWVAEHHSMPAVASTSPAVLLAHLGSATSRIRLGSGGVMLPNHAPLVVAEQFSMLEALHPGRIDLGLGRAPGTDQRTAAALRRGDLTAEDFPQELDALRAYLASDVATPAPTSEPEVWLLGSSDYSARAAAALGLPFAFAHHFSAHNTIPALSLYRRHFKPSSVLAEPHSLVVAPVLAAATQEEAERLALPGKLVQLSLRTGRPRPVPTVEEAEAHPWTELDRQLLAQWPSKTLVGTAKQVVADLDELLEATQADELMLTTIAHSPGHREQALRILAEAWAA